MTSNKPLYNVYMMVIGGIRLAMVIQIISKEIISKKYYSLGILNALNTDLISEMQ